MHNGSMKGSLGGGGGRGGRGHPASGKSIHSRSYPRGVGLDFRKLAGLTLNSYIDHHGVPVRNEAPPSELAVAVARHFESMEVDEENVIGGFLARLSAGRELGPVPLIPLGSNHHSSTSSLHHTPGGGGGGTTITTNADGVTVHVPIGGTTGSSTSTQLSAHPSSSNNNSLHSGTAASSLQTLYTAAAAEYARSTAYFDGSSPSPLVSKRRRSKNAARPGEQVAARDFKASETNVSFILGSVQRFYADTEVYDVADEDDPNKLLRLGWKDVMRLSTGAEGCFHKGTKVLAIFPETTSFYRAKVSKEPVWTLPKKDSTTPIVKELVLKFEDDEDDGGRTHHRRVPSRFVIPLPEAYFHDDDDDVDLTPPPYGIGSVSA